MQYFGDKLKELRQQNKMTQKEVAYKLGLVSGTISAYEQGKKYPSIEILIKICTLFNVSSDYLLGLKEDMALLKTDLTDTQLAIIRQLILELEKKN